MPFKDPVVRRERGRAASQRYRQKIVAARRAADEAGLAARTSPPREDLAWAAGCFEGEGTVTIVRGGRLGYSRGVVSLTNTDREIVDFYRARWGGTVAARKRQKAHYRQAWVWTIGGARMLPFLLDVVSHLRTSAERRKFELAIAAQRARWQGARHHGYAATMEAFRVEMSALNRKGPN